MITISKYHNDALETLKALHAGQKSPTLPYLSSESLPNVGYIAQDGLTTIAMGFLRLVEGGYAQIDTLVSNAELPSQTRHEGISLVVNSLIDTAKELKLKGIMAITDNKSVVIRGESIGFKVLHECVLVRTLQE